MVGHFRSLESFHVSSYFLHPVALDSRLCIHVLAT